jgi:hypothetical protein
MLEALAEGNVHPLAVMSDWTRNYHLIMSQPLKALAAFSGDQAEQNSDRVSSQIFV